MQNKIPTYKSVTAFCPGHISGFFHSIKTSDIITTGSLGGGIVIDSGVTVTLTPGPGKVTIIADRITEGSPVINSLLSDLGVSAEVITKTNLPIGCGFGLSAAALLATAHAANALFSLSLSEIECTIAAHKAEVLNNSGLGDVAAEQAGGYVVRTTPGPLGDIIRRYDVRRLSALSINPIPSSTVLTSPEKILKINSSFPEEMPCTLDELFIISRKFAEKSGLITGSVREVLSICDDNNILATMTMLGEGVVISGDHSIEILKHYGKIYRFSISKTGPYIIEAKK